jgi:hypothetical protein
MKFGNTVALALAAALVGCGGADVKQAAPAGIYLTHRGAESTVPAAVDRLTEAARAAFRKWSVDEMAFEIERDGGRRTLVGNTRQRDVEVTVVMEQRGEGEATVEVFARENLVTYDKSYARDVLESIIEKATGRRPSSAPHVSARLGGAPR